MSKIWVSWYPLLIIVQGRWWNFQRNRFASMNFQERHWAEEPSTQKDKCLRNSNKASPSYRCVTLWGRWNIFLVWAKKIRNIWSEKPKPLSFDPFPLSFFSVVPLCRCWRPEGTRHPQDGAVCRCSYPAHKHYQTSIQPSSALTILLTGFQFGQIKPACSPHALMKRHNHTGYVNISQLMAENENDPLPIQRTVCKGQILSRCYALCSKLLDAVTVCWFVMRFETKGVIYICSW